LPLNADDNFEIIGRQGNRNREIQPWPNGRGFRQQEATKC